MSHFFFSRYGLISSDTKGGREGSSNSAGAAFALAQVDQDLFSLMFQGGRPYMEDLHVILHSLDNVKDVSLFAAIFDGHSGKRAALHAREKLPVCLSSHLSQGIDPVTALHKAFQETDSEFIEQARRESMNDGCTAIALLIHKNNLYVANAGDSRALLVRKDNVVPMSRDHKPNLDSEKSRIVAAGGMVVNLGCPRVQGVLATSRGFGDLELKKFLTCEPEVYNRSICEGDDFLLMASDGVWDAIPSDDVRTILYPSQPRGLVPMADSVIQESLSRGANDNVTAILVDLRPISRKEATSREVTVVDTASVEWKTKNIRR